MDSHPDPLPAPAVKQSRRGSLGQCPHCIGPGPTPAYSWEPPSPAPHGGPPVCWRGVGCRPQGPHTRHPPQIQIPRPPPPPNPPSSERHTLSLRSWMRDQFSEWRVGWRGRGQALGPGTLANRVTPAGCSPAGQQHLLFGIERIRFDKSCKTLHLGPDPGRATHHPAL